MISIERSVSWRPYFIPVAALLFLFLFPFQEAYVAGLFLMLLALLVNIDSVKTLGRGAWWPLLLASCLIVPLLITTTVAYDPEMTLNDALRALAFGLLGVAVVAWFGRSVSSPDRWLGATSAVMLIWIFDALLQYIVGANILGYPMLSSRLTGLFYPAIAVGTVVAHCSPILVETIRRHTRKGRYWHLLWFLLVPMVAVVALGGSRSSWIDFILVMGLYGLYLLLRGHVSWKSVALLLGFTTVSVVVFYSISPEFQSRVARTALLFSGDYQEMNQATSGRFPVWNAAWQAFTEYPILGMGSEAFQDYVTINNLPTHPFKYAHFFLLDVLMMTGLVGLIGYTLFYGLLIRHGWQAVRSGSDFSAVLFICALVMAFPANTHWGFYHYRPVGLMWMFIILAYAFRYHERRFGARPE